MTYIVFGRTIRLFFGRSIDLMPRRMNLRRRKLGRRMKKSKLPKRVKRNLRTARIIDVKRLIHRTRENKLVSHVIENGVYHNSGISNADYYSVMPACTQGAGDNQRIGDQISVRGMYVHVNVALISTFAFNANNPIRVRLFVLAHKSYKQTQGLAANLPPYTTLLRSNDDGTAGSTTQPYDGTPQTHILPVNKEIYTVLKEINFQLAPPDEGLGGGGNALYQANKQFKFKIRCPKLLQYDKVSTGVDFPVNFAPFMAVGYCYPDNSAIPDTTTTKVVVTARSFLYYEDT